MRYKKILVPIDGSDPSWRAMEYAIDLAGTHGAQIVLVHAHGVVPPFLGRPNFENLADKLHGDAREVVEPYVKRLGEAGVAHHVLVTAGRAAEVIKDAAEAEQADLIVISSTGKNGIAGMMVGSVTNRVLHTAHCPVLVVR